MRDTPPPRPIGIDEFLPLVGKQLNADCDPRPVALELVSATPLVNHAKLDRPPFILILRSEPSALLTSASYVLRAKGFGPDVVDIIQIARPAKGEAGHYYQAVFN
ncbi:DUF6916 family protein [Sphingomonas sp. PAMC 26605]|uniref:DUF6916 family protein n=1 Tax=Sphingomonas sp. PAMC 26605 TaxID=1112214 RepID=UPI00026CDD3A|nr:hypothetical protein [Sphingomonas sp. PAMC 26605]